MTSRPLLAAVLAASLSGAGAFAQTTPDDTVVLSPFEVSTDRGTGYRATNSISATRLDTPLQDVPVNIQVVTRDFLDDTLSFRIEDALQYQAAVSVSQQDREQGIFNIRGFTTNRVKRNGFTTYYVHDLGNTERVEVVKGPASLLYGEMEPGGVINYITRRPGPVSRNSLHLTVGSYEHYRATLESSGPIGESLRYGVTASILDDERWTDDWGVKQHSLNGIVQWMPYRGASLTLEGTTLRRREDLRSPIFVYNKANYDAWLQLPAANRLAIARSNDQPSENIAINPAGTGLVYSGQRPLWTDPVDFLPREWNTGGGDLDSDMDELALSFESPLGANHNLRAIVRYTDTSLLWANYAGGSNRLGPAGDGLRGGAPAARLQQNEDLFSQIDFTGNYDLSFGNLRWVAGWERLDGEFLGNNWTRGSTPGIPWIYFDPANARNITSTEIGFVAGQATPSPTFPAKPIGNPFGLMNEDSRQDNILNSFYGMVQGRVLNDRLFVMGGVRREESESDVTNFLNNTVIENPKDEATVPQIGASVKVARGVNFFASYSESFQPQRGTARDANGDLFKRPPQKGEGTDFGVKLELMEGRVSATVSYFDITVTDIMGRESPPEGGPAYDVVIDGRQVDGWEFDGVWQAGGNQLTLSYAKVSGQGIGDLAGQPINNLPEERFAIWNKYDFTRGALKGVFVGLGYSYTSERAISVNSGPFRVFDASYDLWDAVVGYNTRYRDMNLEFRLNVKNILDEEYLVGGGGPGYWGDPRMVYFSTRLTF